VDDAFLTGDAADKEDDRLKRVDTVIFERGRLVGRMVLVDVDAVVDHRDLGRVDVEMLEDVLLGALETAITASAMPSEVRSIHDDMS
jgi:hypothetical protein